MWRRVFENNGNVTFTGAGTLALSSSVTSLGTLSNSAGTVKYDGTSAQTVHANNYYNLTIENASTKTAGGNLDVDGDLTTEAEASCVLDLAAYDLSLAGDLTVGYEGGLDASDASCAITFDGSTSTVTHEGSTIAGSSSDATGAGFEAFTTYWSEEIVADIGTGTPDIAYNFTSGTNPSCTASEGTYFIGFNSFYCGSGSQGRVYKSDPIDASSASTVTVTFDIMSGNSYNYASEGVYIQYKTSSGGAWTTASGIYNVYNASLADGVFYDAIGLRNIGYDAIILGNHDFDFGSEILANFIGEYNAIGGNGTYLSANLDFTGEAGLQALVDNGSIAKSIVVEKAGEQIGIVGATTPNLPFIATPGNVVVGQLLV